MALKIVKKYLDNGQYFNQRMAKKFLFLHHTAGASAMSSWRWWNSTPEVIGTAYLIDRDGTVIECFDPEMWAYHLGIGQDNHYIHKHSIGIELASYGGLHPFENQFRFYPLWPNKLRFVNVHKDEVYELKSPWRGFKYYHKYSDQQIQALSELIPDIKEKVPSLVVDNDLTDFWEYDERVVKDKIPGIWSHTTVSPHKSDIFPYPPLLNSLFETQGKMIGKATSVLIPEVTIKKQGKGTKSPPKKV